jgi:hypothetical protein
MAIQFESFVIEQAEDGNKFQGLTFDGKRREFGIQLVRDLATNKLTLEPYPHFTDPGSERWFEDSEPWTEAERLGQG